MRIRIAVVVVGTMLGLGVLGATVANAAPLETVQHSVSAPADGIVPVGTPTPHK